MSKPTVLEGYVEIYLDGRMGINPRNLDAATVIQDYLTSGRYIRVTIEDVKAPPPFVVPYLTPNIPFNEMNVADQCNDIAKRHSNVRVVQRGLEVFLSRDPQTWDYSAVMSAGKWREKLTLKAKEGETVKFNRKLQRYVLA